MKRRTLLALALLLLTRFALGVVYSLVVPIWEAYDEPGHYAYVRYVAKYRHLLDPADPEARAVYEKFQPPLYYALVAPFLLGFDHGDSLAPPERNPLFANGDAGLNYALHPPRLSNQAAETERAVQTARLAGVLFSTLSVLFVYHLARRVWGRHSGPVWTATLLYAFWPQQLFNGSMVTNDLLVVALSAGILALAVQLAVEGFRAGRALALAVLLAGAVLTKINALALLPVAALALGFALAPLVRHARWRSPAPWLALLGLAGVVGSALYALFSLEFVTSQVLHSRTLERFFEQLAQPEGQQLLLRALPYGFRTFFASFGWGNVETQPWLYNLWALGFGLGLLGLAVGLARPRQAMRGADRRALLLMGLQASSIVSAALALVVALNTIHLAPGRYLLPALPAVIGLMVEGWRVLLPRRVAGSAWKSLGLGAVLVAWAIPLVTLIPTYALPRPLAGTVAAPANAAFGEAIRLIGHQPPAAVQPGEPAQLSVCWQAIAPVAEDYVIFLEAVGPDGQGYGRLVTYPGRGNFATRFWEPGVPFCDRYDLPIGAEMPAPALAWVRVAVLRTIDVNGERLPLTSADGTRVDMDAYVLPLEIETRQRPPASQQALNYRFGDGLRLRGYSLAVDAPARQVRVTLQWEALRDLRQDYVIFVHLRDTPDSAYAQADSAPRGGWYPTRLWQRGEVVEDVHVLTLPAGAPPPLGLYLGVVDPAAEARLTAVNGQGERLANDELLLVEGWELSEWGLPASLQPPGEVAR